YRPREKSVERPPVHGPGERIHCRHAFQLVFQRTAMAHITNLCDVVTALAHQWQYAQLRIEDTAVGAAYIDVHQISRGFVQSPQQQRARAPLRVLGELAVHERGSTHPQQGFQLAVAVADATVTDHRDTSTG